MEQTLSPEFYDRRIRDCQNAIQKLSDEIHWKQLEKRRIARVIKNLQVMKELGETL